MGGVCPRLKTRAVSTATRKFRPWRVLTATMASDDLQSLHVALGEGAALASQSAALAAQSVALAARCAEVLSAQSAKLAALASLAVLGGELQELRAHRVKMQPILEEHNRRERLRHNFLSCLILAAQNGFGQDVEPCLLYTSPSPRDS